LEGVEAWHRGDAGAEGGGVWGGGIYAVRECECINQQNRPGILIEHSSAERQSKFLLAD